MTSKDKKRRVWAESLRRVAQLLEPTEEEARAAARERAVYLASGDDAMELHLLEDWAETGVVALGKDSQGTLSIAVVYPGQEELMALVGPAMARKVVLRLLQLFGPTEYE